MNPALGTLAALVLGPLCPPGPFQTPGLGSRARPCLGMGMCFVLTDVFVQPWAGGGGGWVLSELRLLSVSSCGCTSFL